MVQVSGEHAADVPDQALRSALEFAVGIAAAGVKLRPPLAFPVELKRFLRFHKLPPAALAQVRAAVEADHDFRRRLALVATEELVDPVGVLWLTRPDGWSEAITDLLPTNEIDEATAMRREERRRQAAQDAAARARAELLALTSELERERTARSELAAEADRLRVELDEVRQRLREAQRAEHASAQALVKAETALLEVRERQHEVPEPVELPPVVDVARVRKLIDGAVSASGELTRLLADALAELPPDEPRATGQAAQTAGAARARRRSPLRLRGGVLADSAEAAEFLLRSEGVTTLVDGYNVAKLGWPSLDLDQQRQQCILAAENLAKRWNLTLTVVFDGASVEGAHASSRRRVRIVYSPAGVSADDVLRAEVAKVDAQRPVVVVTNDRAIVTDVIAAGANTIPSSAFLALANR